MFKLERFRLLMDRLSERGTMSIEEVVTLLSVSEATARRDCLEMATMGLILRLHGGIALPSHAVEKKQTIDTPVFNASLLLHAENKQKIAHAAGKIVNGHTSLIINGGSTCLYFAQALRKEQRHILTNSHVILDTLARKGCEDIYITSGRYYDPAKIVLSPYEDYAGHFFGDLLITSCASLTPRGALETDPLLVQAICNLAHHAERVVLLVDGSKFMRGKGLLSFELETIDIVITDVPPPAELRDSLQANGCQLIVASSEKE